MTHEFLLDHNPLTGESVHLDFEDGKMVMTHSQDVSGFLDWAGNLANDTDRTKRGIKDDFWHYAKVPNSVILEMKHKHGVDFFNKDHAKKVFQLLNTEYKRFKTTDKVHLPR